MTNPSTAEAAPSPPASRTEQPRWQNLGLLSAFVRPHRARLVLALLLGLGYTAAALATPLATKWVLDTVGEPGSLTAPVGLLLALLVIGMVLGLLQAVLLGRLAERIVLDARSSLVRRFFRAVLPDLQHRSTGELVTRVTSDTVLLREATSSSLVNLVNGAVSLVGTVVLMAVLDLPLLVCTLVAIAVVAVLIGLLMPPIAKAQQQAQASVGRMGGLLEGGLRAVRTVKSARAEQREIDRVVAEAGESAEHAVRAVRIEAVAWTIAGGGIQLAIIAILALGAVRVGSGALAVSTLVAFLLYAFQIVEPVTGLTMNVTQLQSGVAAAARIRELESMAIEDVEAGEPAPAEADGAAVLALVDVTVTYPGATRNAVEHLDLAIPRRGHTAIVGPSGAGKTTTFSLLLRFVEATSGRVEMDGVPYDRLSIDAVRSRIAYVEQDAPLLAGTVRDNVLLRQPEASEEEAWAALRAVRMAETVRALPGGLDEPVAGTSLSGGERQRLAMARAVVRDPQVLLLDEATAQLDGLTEAAIQDVIHRVARTGAVVTIAHRLSTVIDADRIFLLDDGRLRATGTHAELLATDTMYRELVAALRISTEATPVV